MKLRNALTFLHAHSLELLFFPAVVFYSEVVMHVSTVGGFALPSLLAVFLISFAVGCLMQMFRSLGTNRIVRTVITLVLLIANALFFLAMYIMFLQFKVFYDLNTILFAAKDATTGFRGEIVRLVTSGAGLTHLLLFFLPVLLYAAGLIILRVKDASYLPAYDKEKRLLLLAGIFFASLAAAVTIRLSPRLYAAIGKNYNYAATVRQFGLITGVARDAYGLVTGSDRRATFTAQQTAVPRRVPKPVETDEPVVQREEEIVYEKNSLDIDFETLAEAGGTFGEVDRYVSSLEASSQNKYTGLFVGKNLIFLSLESFSGFMIDEELTPTLYRMQHQGIFFTDFYQPSSASTTGGEYSLLKGLLPMAGAASMTNSAYFHNYMTLGSFFSREGYYGQTFHNGDAYYYDRYITHNRLGYTSPYMAYGSGMEQLIERPWPRSDVDMIRATAPLYMEEDRFNIYYMTVSGHAPYSPANSYYAGNPYGTGPNGTNYFAEKNLDRVADLSYSDLLKYYIACNLEVEDMAAALLALLEEYGVLEDTVIAMCADHFPYGINDGGGYKVYLEELYGRTIGNDLDRDANALIIWTPSLEEEETIVVDEPVSSLDVLPTLLNLFGMSFDARLFPGRDALSDAPALVFNISYDWKTEWGSFTAATGVFEPAAGVDTDELPDDYVEQISAIVDNKISFCRSLTYYDYYYHVFGESLGEGVVQPQIVTPPFPKTEEVPVTEVPAEGLPAEGVPAEGVPAEGLPAEGAPAEGVPAEQTPPPAEGQ